MAGRWIVSIVTVGLAALGALLTGCAVIGFGAMAYEQATPRHVRAEYDGLQGHSFAVVIAADRFIEAEHPALVTYLTAGFNREGFARDVGASGWVPPERLLRYQANHPRWRLMSMGELAQAIGVERMVYIDLYEYRLREPGNQYLWDGLAQGRVGVIEADAPFPDEFQFEREVSVRFPGGEASYSPADIPLAAVNTELAQRFIARTRWLFFAHDEPRDIEY